MIRFIANLYSLISFHFTSKKSFLFLSNVPKSVIFAPVSMSLNMVLYWPRVLYPFLCMDILHSPITRKFSNIPGRIAWYLSTSISQTVVWVIKNYLVCPRCLEKNHFQSIFGILFFIVIYWQFFCLSLLVAELFNMKNIHLLNILVWNNSMLAQVIQKLFIVSLHISILHNSIFSKTKKLTLV